jgi:hypothetical protein
MALYLDISDNNLNPGNLYIVTSPYHERTISSRPLRPALIALGILVTLTFVVASAGCLIHAVNRRNHRRALTAAAALP